MDIGEKTLILPEEQTTIKEHETCGQFWSNLSALKKILLILTFCLLVAIIAIVTAVLVKKHSLSHVVEKTFDPIVQTKCGAVQGVIEVVESDVGGPSDSVYVFKGIPFAKPPINNLRWKPPVPLTKVNNATGCWKGTYRANEFKSPCAQIDIWGTKKITGSEDCLYLSVWTPTLKKEKLPVVVWLHGGYLLSGSGNIIGYSPNAETTKSMNVVFVSFNYRLNVFGFLALDVLSMEAKTKTSGNYGLMDQISVFKWIQRNIENFGGDSKRVTLLGQSSGGTSIFGLLASKEAQGLFQSVIPMSGSPVYNKTTGETSKDNLIFITKSKCNHTSTTHTRNCLYKLSKETLLKATPWFVFPYWAMLDLLDLPTKNLFDGAVCIVDGDVVSFPPGDIKLHPKWAKGKISILLGSTAQEIDWTPVQRFGKKTYAEFETFVKQRLGTFSPAIANKSLTQYANIDNRTAPQYVYETMTTDVRVTCPSNILSYNFSLSPMHTIYRYIVTNMPSKPARLPNYPTIYASHMWDSVAFFGFHGRPTNFQPNNKDLAFKEDIRKQFSHFFKHGSPENSKWKPYPENIGIFSNNGVKVVKDYHKDQCKFWNENGFFPYAWIN